MFGGKAHEPFMDRCRITAAEPANTNVVQGMGQGDGPPLRPPGEGADFMPPFARKAGLHL